MTEWQKRERRLNRIARILGYGAVVLIIGAIGIAALFYGMSLGATF